MGLPSCLKVAGPGGGADSAVLNGAPVLERVLLLGEDICWISPLGAAFLMGP